MPRHVPKFKCKFNTFGTSPRTEVELVIHFYNHNMLLLLVARALCIHLLPLHLETTCNNIHENSFLLPLYSEHSELFNVILPLGKGMCSRCTTCENIRTIKSWWVVSQLPNLLLKNDKDLNVLSYSTLPNTWTWAIFVIFVNSETLWRWGVARKLAPKTGHWVLIMSKGMTTCTFDIMAILKKKLWSSWLHVSRVFLQWMDYAKNQYEDVVKKNSQYSWSRCPQVPISSLLSHRMFSMLQHAREM